MLLLDLAPHLLDFSDLFLIWSDHVEWNWISNFGFLSGWLYFGFVTFLVITVVVRKQEPSAALGWSLAIVFMPVIGPLLFLLFGINRVSRRLRRKLAHRDSFDAAFSLSEEFYEREKSFCDEYPNNRWGKIGQLLENLDGPPRHHGNDVALYHDGATAFQEMSKAIEQAQHHIHIEFYIFRYDEVGKDLIQKLIEKISQGVEVRLIVDAVGTLVNSRILRKIRAAGGEAASFRTFFSHRRSPNLRNHRKVIICDGKIAFFGGMNVGTEYLGRFWKKNRQRDWYDLHLKLAGPSVWDLQLMFLEDWDFCTGNFVDQLDYFPDCASPSNASVQIVTGGPDTRPNPIHKALFAAFTRAEKRIVIATPYLAPDLSLREALKTAALSGIEVHIVTQSFPPDSYLVYYCGQNYIEEFLAVGIRVSVYTPGMMHAKSVVIDGEWAMIGTANLDNRSMFLNFEQMAILDGEEEVRTLGSELEDLVTRSTELDLEALRQRPRLEKLLVAGARLLTPLM